MRKLMLTLLLLVTLTVPAGVAAQEEGEVTLTVSGFEVVPEEVDTPHGQSLQAFLDAYREAYPNVTLESVEAAPDETQLIVDLAAGTAPDVWAGSVSQTLIDQGAYLDVTKCLDLTPDLNLDRFFPNVLAVHQRGDALYGLPNDFTPMVIFYNPEAFERAGVELPQDGWTWDDLVDIAQRLTLDAEGRNRLDPDFDEENVVQWGYRVRKYAAFEWAYRAWENGGEIIAPDGSTVDGYLNSPETIEAAQFHQDLLLKYGVSPIPSALDSMTQELGFTTLFLQGQFAMYDRGHWELVGLQSNEEFSWDRVGVIGQPAKDGQRATVLYESGFFINAAVEEDPDKLQAACNFIELATGPLLQDAKVLTGIAISANQESSERAIEQYEKPEIGQAFFNEVQYGRPEPASQYTNWSLVEESLSNMMELILDGEDVEEMIDEAVDEIDRELDRASSE
jgi:multiple sugar transport system substrate-binding protein